MSGATLTIEPRPELGVGVRRFEIDCRHATTTAVLLPGPFILGDSAIVQALLLSHDVEGCGCTYALHQRYGSGIPGR
jgi:hypothetical protein